MMLFRLGFAKLQVDNSSNNKIIMVQQTKSFMNAHVLFVVLSCSLRVLKCAHMSWLASRDYI
jgi:hypothetical protein